MSYYYIQDPYSLQIGHIQEESLQKICNQLLQNIYVKLNVLKNFQGDIKSFVRKTEMLPQIIETDGYDVINTIRVDFKDFVLRDVEDNEIPIKNAASMSNIRKILENIPIRKKSPPRVNKNELKTLQHSVDSKVVSYQSKVKNIESENKEYRSQLDSLNQKRKELAKEKDKNLKKRKEFEEKKKSYLRLKQSLEDKDIREEDIPEIFADDYTIFKLMEEEDSIDNFQLYTSIKDELIEEDNSKISDYIYRNEGEEEKSKQ